jgi:dTDP-4-dehydrorhamnose 3,5-epimerase
MSLEELPIKDLFIYEPEVFEDFRGYFFESYNKTQFDKILSGINFVQDNEAFSKRGVLRGLHYQTNPMAQSKLVRVVKGKVLDVVVDLREDSDTYGQHFSIILSGKNKLQFFIPKGFAHGYITLSKRAIFSYKCDQYYSKPNEGGVLWNDPTLNIDWKISVEKIKISAKDKAQPKLGDHKKFI